MSRYRIHAASIDTDGLHLSPNPRAYARTLHEALAASADAKNHGPEGAAIVTPRGKIIYTADEYRVAEERATR